MALCIKKDIKTRQRTHPCKVCGKVIIGNTFNINAHMYLHGIVRSRFICSYCPKEYYRKDVYTRHIAVHEGTVKRSFVCDHCERGFVDKRNLILHLKIHDDLHIQSNLEFKCTACNATYCEKRLLMYHIRKTHYNLHNKEPNLNKKKFNETWIERVKESEEFVEITKVNNNILQIKKCGKMNNEDEKKNNKKKKNDSKEYLYSIYATKDKSQYSKAVCDYCKKEMLKKSMKSHIRERHLKIKKFKCDTCKESFNRHYQMVNHVCGKYKSMRKRRCN